MSCGKRQVIPNSEVKEVIPQQKQHPYKTNYDGITITKYNSEVLLVALKEPTELIGYDTFACGIKFLKVGYYLDKKIDVVFNRVDGPEKKPIAVSFENDGEIWVDPGVYELGVQEGSDSVMMAANLSRIGHIYECRVSRNE